MSVNNVTLEPLAGREYLLDGYLTGISEVLLVEGKEYKLQRYQNDHQNEYSLIEMKNGIADGNAQLFKNGALMLAWHNENGKQIGRFTVYSKGKVDDNREWEEIFGNDDIYRIVNNEYRIDLEITDRTTGHIVYRGGFTSDKHTRSGLGYEYDGNSGKMKRFGEWRNNEMWRILQLFDNDGEMMEFLPGSDSNMDVIAQRPVYAGHYAYDETDGRCKRHGKGRELDIKSGMAISFGQWNMGIKTSVSVMKNGWYENNLSEEKMDLQDVSLGDVKCCNDTLDSEAAAFVISSIDSRIVADFQAIWSYSCRLPRTEKWQILCASYRSEDGEEVRNIIESGSIHDIFLAIVTKARQLDALVKEMKKWQDEKHKLIDSELRVKTLQKALRSKYNSVVEMANEKHIGISLEDYTRNDLTIRLCAFMFAVNSLKKDTSVIQWDKIISGYDYSYRVFNFQIATIAKQYHYGMTNPTKISIYPPSGMKSILKNNTITSLENCYCVADTYYIILPLAPFKWSVVVESGYYSVSQYYKWSPLNEIECSTNGYPPMKNWRNSNLVQAMIFNRDLFNFQYDTDPLTTDDIHAFFTGKLDVSFYENYIQVTMKEDNTAVFGISSGKVIQCKEMSSLYMNMSFKQMKQCVKRQIYSMNDYVILGKDDMTEVKAVKDEVTKEADDVNNAINEYKKRMIRMQEMKAESDEVRKNLNY